MFVHVDPKAVYRGFMATTDLATTPASVGENRESDSRGSARNISTPAVSVVDTTLNLTTLSAFVDPGDQEDIDSGARLDSHGDRESRQDMGSPSSHQEAGNRGVRLDLNFTDQEKSQGDLNPISSRPSSSSSKDK